MSQRPDYFRGEATCGQDRCKTRTYFLQDGLIWCRRGHRQEKATQTQQDDDARASQGQGQKTRKRREVQDSPSRVARGASAKELFLQGYQFILWKQCYALIHTIGLPPELEDVVQSLWAFRLQLLKDKTNATSDEETVYSSQPASESENEKGKEEQIVGKAMPTLLETLALCYLGMMLLRLPVSIGDLHRWAIREDVPFIRAIRFVPTVIKQKLPAEYVMALDTTSTLEPDDLRKVIHNLNIFYKHHFGLAFPPVNAHLLLFKHIRGLALPMSLYPIVLRLANLLSIDFNFPEPGQGQKVSLLPEVSLICLVVIAVKLYHPFDALPRFASSLNDPAVLKVNWSKWTDAQRDHELRLKNGVHLVRGSEMEITEDDAMQMSGEQLDDYLDWYERTWVDEERAQHKSGGVHQQLRDWFPTRRQNGFSPTLYDYADQTRKEQQSAEIFSAGGIGAMELREVIVEQTDKSEDETNKIGSHYKRYRKLTDLTSNVRVFHEAIADAVGLKVETILVAVSQVEQRLIDWRKKKLKAQGDGEADDLLEGDELSAQGDSDREERVDDAVAMEVDGTGGRSGSDSP